MNINKYKRCFLNLFFRGNNLLVAYVKAFTHNNHLNISCSSNLINCKFVMLGGGNIISIGPNCTLKNFSIYMNDSNNAVYIGKDVIVNGRKYGLTRFNACNGTSIHIGDGCLFSNNIELHTTDYHPILNSKNERVNDAESITIGEHSWIGLRTIVLKGVQLPPHTIVGACSVLMKSKNKEYEECEVLAGNPAKIILQGYTWNH